MVVVFLPSPGPAHSFLWAEYTGYDDDDNVFKPPYLKIILFDHNNTLF